MHSNQSYEDCTAWLFEQFPSYQKIGSKAYKPTLENTRKLLSIFDNPEKKLKFIHIAGSNGKGSTAAYIASLSRESGYKTGLFTSPHIKDFRERIRVNDEMINEANVIQFVRQIQNFKLDFNPSFFEMTLVLALLYFSELECDIVVLETGLGGRLDATNVVRSEISIITTISLEHQKILGNTIEKIAVEKAGIIKNGNPILIGNVPSNAREEIVRIASDRASQVIDFEYKDWKEIPLITDYQKINLSIADTAVKIMNQRGWNFKLSEWPSAIQNLSKNTGFFGRFEIVNKNPLEVWDVSHNAEGIQTTLSSFEKMFEGHMNIVIGLSSDKNILEIVRILPSKSNLFVTTFSSERSASMDQLRSAFETKKFEKVMYFSNPKTAINRAKEHSSFSDGTIVLGSFFLFENLF